MSTTFPLGLPKVSTKRSFVSGRMGAGEIQDGVGDCGGAGSHGEGAHAPFERGNALLQDILSRVGQAAVDVARVGEAEAGGGVFAAVEDVGGSLVDGDRAGVGGGVGMLLSHVELKGLEVQFAGAHIRSFYIVFCLQS